jgi:hypothetical protein
MKTRLLKSLSLSKKMSKSKVRSFRSLRSSRSKSISLHYTPLKSISITKSNQGDEGTCLAHTCAHLVVKNIFEKLYPLKLSKKEKEIYKQHSCNEFLKTHELLDISLVNECSLHGYYKILLFLYVYYTAYDNFIIKGKKKYLAPIVSFVLQLEYIPNIFNQTFHLPIVLHLLKTMKQKIIQYKVKFDTVTIEGNQGDELIIRKILDGDFYVAMNLVSQVEESKSNSPKYIGHSSTIVAHTPTQFIVKNTWQESLDYIPYKDLQNVHLIYSNKRWKLDNYFTVLPIFENMELYDGFREDFVTDLEIEERELELYKPWIFNYISKFKKLKV